MWSLGLIAYILLTGKHPFFEPDTTRMFVRVAAADYQFKPEDWRNTSTDAKVWWGVGCVCLLPYLTVGARFARATAAAAAFFFFLCRDFFSMTTPTFFFFFVKAIFASFLVEKHGL